MDVAIVEQLDAAEGRALADTATAAFDDGGDLVAVTASLRSQPGADAGLVSAAITQARLRIRARPRFGALADRLLWTEAGLEQATRLAVAEHRAARVRSLDPARLVDLCCGVGGDLLALAAAVPGATVVGVDRDPVTVAVAQANVRALGLADRVRVDQADVTGYDVRGADVVFVDPARRGSTGRRTFDPDAYQPPYAFVVDLAATHPAVVAKVAPGIPHTLVPDGAEAEWVSDHGEVKEAALWCGALAGAYGPAGRRATLLPSGASLVDRPGLGPPRVGAVGPYVYEPDGAVIRAGLVAEVAAALDGWLLHPSVAYVAAGTEVATPFAHGYAVVEAMPFQLKRLRAALRDLDAADVVVKKRAIALDPEDVRRRLRLTGDGPTYTVLLTRTDDGPLALITQPAPG